MKSIAQNIKAGVIKDFLSGLSFDEIATKWGISHGSVANIIDEFRDGVLPLPLGIGKYIDELRRVAVDLRKHGTNVEQLQGYIRLYGRLKEMGVRIDQVEGWLDICERVASEESAGNKFVKSALELDRLSSKTRLDYEALIQNYRQRLVESQELGRKIEASRRDLENLRRKYQEEEGQAMKKLNLINNSIATAQANFEKQRQDLSTRLDEHLEQNRLSWERVKTAEAMVDGELGANGFTREQIAGLRKKVKDAGSLVTVIKQLKEETARLNSEVAQINVRRDDYVTKLEKLEHTHTSIKGLIAEMTMERNKLDNELASKRVQLAGLNQEISRKREDLYMTHSIIDFLLDPKSISDRDLDYLVSMMIDLRRDRLGIKPKQVRDNLGRIICECQTPKRYIMFAPGALNIDVARRRFAFWLTPLVKDKFVSTAHYELARVGWECVYNGPRGFRLREIERPRGNTLVLPSFESLFAEDGRPETQVTSQGSGQSQNKDIAF
jgi:translation initiation factor 2B subunit (eIF-2B alpha/beta/delta family)